MAEGGEKRNPSTHRTPSQAKRHTAGYQAKPSVRKKRAKNNAARAKVKKSVGAKAIAGKDVGHKTPLSKGGTNASSNLALQSKKKNRGHGMTRGKKANKGK
jgi:hypothetical protein